MATAVLAASLVLKVARLLKNYIQKSKMRQKNTKVIRRYPLSLIGAH